MYGYDAVAQEYVNPTRMHLGLEKDQVCSPELIERICYTATQTLSFQACEKTMRHWGVDVTDTTIHKMIQRQGKTIDQFKQIQVQRALEPATRQAVVGKAKSDLEQEDFSLVVMMDGWMIRERGTDWGLTPPDTPGKRSEWHEMKTGIVFRLEDRAQSQSDRAMLIKKHCVSWRGDPETFGQRLWAMALSQGLYQARRVIVVADGAAWIWNLSEHRFSQAIEQLDFYHASQHLWQAARALYPKEAEAKAWVEPLLSQLRHGSGASLSAMLEKMCESADDLNEERSTTLESQIRYFHNHSARMEYGAVSALGAPIGSGAMESTCAQLQNRFKRTGQFWTHSGAHNLMLIEALRKNDEWAEIWERQIA